MPARMMQPFSQEVADFDRQMGCMAGVFHIFDRRHLLTARQRGGGRGARSTQPPGHALPSSSSSSNVSVQNSATKNITLEKTSSKSMTENSSLSMESLRASSSSSCCLFSSQDGNKPVQQELPNINEELFAGRPLRSSPSLKCSKIEAKSRHPNTGFGDIVKDSINRDSHGLAVKTSMKEARNGSHKDSPRPLLISKSTDGTYVIGIDRSIRVPAYVHESSRPQRFSFDDRQLLRPVEAQDSKKPSAKLRDLPRLSLDSSKESMNPSSRLKSFGCIKTDDNLLDALKPQESPSHRPASSVVAKLMGLEETPDIYEPSRSPRPVHSTQNDRPSQSPRSTCQDPSVSQPMNRSPALKTKSSPRIFPEAAPWRQQERGVTGYESEARPRSASVYADIQRRLRGLELSECNKDLRALRILGALHAKDTPCQSDTNAGLMPIQKAASERTTNSEKFQSPIVIMKLARGITKPDSSLALVAPLAGPRGLGKLQHDEPTFTRKNENSDRKRIHSHNESAHSRGDEHVSGASSLRPSSTLSPRLVQKKADSERRSRKPVPPMSPSKKSNEAASPRGRLRSKPLQAKSICNNDEVLQIPESKISLAKQVDVGVIGYPNPLNVNSPFIHQSNTASTLNHQETSTILYSDKKKIQPLENIPSPVSVLDASFYFYHDGSSPSLKRISDSFKDGETHTSDECWNPTSLPDTPPSKTRSGSNQIKPENVKALIQKLEFLQLLSDEALNTNEILSSVTANKDHQYIYEILSASVLVHNELSFRGVPHQLRSSSCSINPELFLILEQAKPETNKLHRRLMFDLANELITQKMDINHSASRSAQFLQSKKLSGWQLFKDLCAEIDRLQSEASMIRCSEEEEDESMLAEDVIRGMEEWKSFDSELKGMVLGIERSIFKDLIDEVISDEATEKMQLRQWKLRRQLSFSSI